MAVTFVAMIVIVPMIVVMIMMLAVGVVMPIMVVMVAHECLASFAACRSPITRVL